MRGWRYLRKHEVDYNILCTVNAANQQHGRAVYRFFRDELGASLASHPDHRARHRQRSRSPTRAGARNRPPAPTSTHADRQPGHRAHGGRRAIRAFPHRHLREWVRHDVGQVYVQMFDVTLEAFFGVIVASNATGHGLVLEHNGEILHLRSLRRAEEQARQHPPDPHDRADCFARRSASSARTNATCSPPSAKVCKSSTGATAAARRTGSRCRATASWATTFARASSCSSPTPGRPST